MLDYIIPALIMLVVGMILPRLYRKVVGKITKYTLDYPSSDSYHVVELHSDRGNSFWFRKFLEQQVVKPGVNRISLSKRHKYVLVLIKSNGQYEHTLLINGCGQQVPDDWRQHLQSFGYPTKGYPTRKELDGLYSYQVRRRNATRRRSGHPAASSTP